jgi:hypothetical protein
MHDYPTIRMVLQYRTLIPGLAAAFGVLLGVWVMLRTGWPEGGIAGVALGAVLYVAARAAVELVHLISETLMPR